VNRTILIAASLLRVSDVDHGFPVEMIFEIPTMIEDRTAA
jgi:hypothetical protein